MCWKWLTGTEKQGKTTKEPRLRCPRCGTLMRKIQKGEVLLDVCDGCKGMWLDHGEVDKLAAMGRSRRKH